MVKVIEVPAFTSAWEGLDLSDELRLIVAARLLHYTPSPLFPAGAIGKYCLTTFMPQSDTEKTEISIAVYYSHDEGTLYLLHVKIGIIEEWSREEKKSIYAGIAKILISMASEM